MKRKPREFWERHVRDCEGSGLGLRAYCTAHGLKRSTFDTWRRRVAKQSSMATGFVPLRVSGAAPAGPSVALRWPSGLELALSRDCDPLWLAQVLSGLR